MGPSQIPGMKTRVGLDIMDDYDDDDDDDIWMGKKERWNRVVCDGELMLLLHQAAR